MERNKKKKEEPKGFAANLWVFAHDLVYILAAITLVFTFAVRLVGVSGSSMYPTLIGKEGRNRGDYLALLSNMVDNTYEKGDIVVACVPSFENGKPIVKRVIATEGQTVDLRPDTDGTWRVWVDGKPLEDETYIREPMQQTYYETISFPATVPAGCYFCMGDNRNNSSDSRYYQIGMIDGRYIVGKTLLVALPGEDSAIGNTVTWSRFGGIK